MAQGLGAFAQGLVNGYVTGQKMKQTQELHDLEVEKLREEKAFKDELKAINQDVKPVEQYTVAGPDGAVQVFDSQDAALKAMEGGDGFQLSRNFLVGDQTFDDAEQAQFAARMANTPAMKLARQAEVAMRYGQPQMAAAFAKAHDDIIETNRKMAWDQLDAYERSGNVEGVLSLLDNQAGDGGRAQLVDDGQGNLIIAREVNGQMRPFMGPFKDTQDLFSTVKHGLSVNYGNALALYQFEKGHGLDERRFAETQRHNRVSEGLSAGHLGVAQAGLNLRKTEHDIRKTEHDWAAQDRANPVPTIRHGYTPEGDVHPFTERVTRDAQGVPSVSVQPLSPLTGVRGSRPQADPYAFLGAMTGANPGPRTVNTNVPPTAGAGLVEMNNQRLAPRAGPTQGLAPAPTPAPATTPGRSLGDMAPDWLYNNSPALRTLSPRSGNGGSQ